MYGREIVLSSLRWLSLKALCVHVACVYVECANAKSAQQYGWQWQRQMFALMHSKHTLYSDFHTATNSAGWRITWFRDLLEWIWAFCHCYNVCNFFASLQTLYRFSFIEIKNSSFKLAVISLTWKQKSVYSVVFWS